MSLGNSRSRWARRLRFCDARAAANSIIGHTVRSYLRPISGGGTKTGYSRRTFQSARGIFVPFDVFTAWATKASEDTSPSTRARMSDCLDRMTIASEDATPGTGARAHLWKYGRIFPNRISPI